MTKLDISTTCLSAYLLKVSDTS